jgi:hypothetical protein
MNRLQHAVTHPLKLSLDTIFGCAEDRRVETILFEPRRVEIPTETEGFPAPVVPAGSVVLSVFYGFSGKCQWQLTYGYGKDELMDQLKRYRKNGWHLEFSDTDLGERVVAQRL